MFFLIASVLNMRKEFLGRRLMEFSEFQIIKNFYDFQNPDATFDNKKYFR